MLSKRPYFYRIYFLALILVLVACGLLTRIVYLGTIKKGFLEHESAARSLRVVGIPAHRGMIIDRNGAPLAVSTPVEAVWASPDLYNPDKESEAKLAKIIGIPLNFLRKHMEDAADRSFVYLKRRLPPEDTQKIKALSIPGVFTQQEYQRYYPEGEVTAQLLGFTNIDDRGTEGLELAYDKWLRGIPGKREVIKDRLGHIVNELRVINEPQSGRDLALSIDRNIQYLAYKELKNTVEKYHAESGSAVVLDVKTGDVLAVVNQPSYNPNARSGVHLSALRNRAATDLFEPGSIIKTFSIASALESGKYHPWTKIDTNPGYYYLDGHLITDREVHDMNYGVISVKEVLQKSSNVGVSKITLTLSPNRLLSMLKRVGFGESTYSGFPGEGVGHLPDNLIRRPFVLATLSYGYSISVTPLQLARAYAVFASGGILRPVSFLKVDNSPPGQQVLAPELAREIMKMLESVVEDTEGTGTKGKIAGYNVAGKTGTAYIAGASGYGEHKDYSSVFVGIAPVTNPRLVVVVMIRKPQTEHFGALVAAPAFANIMDGALRVLNISPDNLNAIPLPQPQKRPDAKKPVTKHSQTEDDANDDADVDTSEDN